MQHTKNESGIFDIRGLDQAFANINSALLYEETDNIEIPRGAESFADLVNEGLKTTSVVNKLHIMKLSGNYPAMEKDYKPVTGKFFSNTSLVDLCKKSFGVNTYEVEDFLYCRDVGVPVNRLITLRRFPGPVTDNIYGKTKYSKQKHPDIARLCTYATSETNKLEDILSISYSLRWKELQAEMEQMSTEGEQGGFGKGTMIESIAKIFDGTTNGNYVNGSATGGPMSSYNPTHDQNRVYGPVDSITQTNIRDVGIEFEKEFEIEFNYSLRSIGGKSPEYAMKDILGNVLAVTFNNAKFWGGARYWVGERPSPWAAKLQWMNGRNVDQIISTAKSQLSNFIRNFMKNPKESSLAILKNAIRGGIGIALGKILDGLGRPSIVVANSLLSGEPTGAWHLTIGHPSNPIMVMGNLILTGTEIKFPGDALSYGNFPTQMQVICRLKPGKDIDRAGIETIFNHGKQRLYWNPKRVRVLDDGSKAVRKSRYFAKESNSEEIGQTMKTVFDFSSAATKDKEDYTLDVYHVNNDTDGAPAPLNRVERNADGSTTTTTGEAVVTGTGSQIYSDYGASPVKEIKNTDVSGNLDDAEFDLAYRAKAIRADESTGFIWFPE